MSNRYLGKTIDIHCGGQDLTFPHHENEIAQSEAANGCKFVNYWVHNGFISIDNRKMSKSLGNFFTVREAAEAYGYPTIRMFMLMSHYRSPLNYSGEILIQAQNALERLKTAHTNLKFLMENGAEGDMTPEEQKFADSLDTYRQRFDEDMDDDFNTADAISVIFELVRDANTVTGGSPTKAVAKAAFDVLDELQGVLGLIYGEENEDEKLAEEVEALIQARQQARKDKNWAEADRIRDQLKDMGIVLMDTKQGVQWKKA
jgi:cysteinyl-tRNA synthetase